MKKILQRLPLLSAALALAAGGLAGCATQTSSAPAPHSSRIVLKPTDEAFRGAMLGLSAAEQATIRKGLGFTVDTLLHAPVAVDRMQWSRVRPDTPLEVNISDFVRYFDLQPAARGPGRVNIAAARVFAGVNYSQSTFGPVFSIQMEVESSNATVVNISGFGGGPLLDRPGDETPLASPRIEQSAEIAFMKAFLKALLKVNEQVLQS